MKKAKESDKIAVNKTQANQETFAMKTITEILGGAQALLDMNYDLQSCFEEHLTDGHKSFLSITSDYCTPTGAKFSRDYCTPHRIKLLLRPFHQHNKYCAVGF